MEKKRNLCAMVPISIFNRFGAERDKAGLTNSEYATKILEEYFSVKDKGGNGMAQNNGKTRTLAFQISEEFFQRIKTYLEKESKRLGRKVTQDVFCQGERGRIQNYLSRMTKHWNDIHSPKAHRQRQSDKSLSVLLVKHPKTLRIAGA